MYRVTTFCCRVLYLLKTVKACCEVFSQDGEFESEAKEIVKIRAKSRREFFKTQHPMFPFWFRSLWSLLMLLVTAGGSGLADGTADDVRETSLDIRNGCNGY